MSESRLIPDLCRSWSRNGVLGDHIRSTPVERLVRTGYEYTSSLPPLLPPPSTDIIPGQGVSTMTRRDALLGMGSAVLLRRADAQVTPDMVQFRPEIEPLVRLMERTPRERCAEMLVEQLHAASPTANSSRRCFSPPFATSIRDRPASPCTRSSSFTRRICSRWKLRPTPVCFRSSTPWTISKRRRIATPSQPAGDYPMRPIAALPAATVPPTS